MDTTHNCPICQTDHDIYTLGCDGGLGCQHCDEADKATLVPLPLPSASERLAVIHAHLARGGKVMVATYTQATIYSTKHADWFTATTDGLYVRRGKSKDCLNFTPVKFSR